LPRTYQQVNGQL